ncbi:MAG TPA: AGE family epimerase/isomerase [Candidatus Limiplasma sp.]|nr:AGE family epimerase/isomerase [Candidatus Limiplasma sp.]
MDLQQAMARHLTDTILPFWTGLTDTVHGGYTGYVGYDLQTDPDAPKGCIMNSRILWFFSTACTVLKRPDLLYYAQQAYRYFDRFVDAEQGGLFWLCAADGTPLDETKHTYNHAFAVYALAAYYQASGDMQALHRALALVELMETRMTKDGQYLDAFDRAFHPLQNDKLSDNPILTARGVIAEKTMNTVLHVLEAYTLVYEACCDARVGERLRDLLALIRDKVYNAAENRLDVFFDSGMHSLIDMQSYGHDIEASWLIDRAADAVLTGEDRTQIKRLTTRLAQGVLTRALTGGSLCNERVEDTLDTTRIWWVQAETMIGMANLYQKTKNPMLPERMRTLWRYIQTHIVDPRPGGEWFAAVDAQGSAKPLPIADPWKAPYHNGRMCMEMMKRL